MPALPRQLLLAVAALAALASCAKARQAVEPGDAAGLSRCTRCHGDPARGATELLRAAPPFGLRHGSTPADLDVGAHQAHLGGKSFSGGLPCHQCHAEPGSRHPDGVTHFAFEAAGNLAPATRYDPAGHSCATSYCHDPAGTGRTSPAWNAPGPLACDGCHDLPPAASTGHPAVPGDLTGCAACHPATMKADGTLDLAGGHHVNGVVEALGHGDYSLPSTHGPRALDFLGGVSGSLDCRACHGQDFGGGFGPSCSGCHAEAGWTGWQTNCSFCHGTRSTATQAGYDVAAHPSWAAPPDALAQRLDPAHAPVPSRTGAHQAHLADGPFSAALTCATCHAVPGDLGHVRGAAARATVALSGAGQRFFQASLGSYDPATSSCATYCHGATPSPAWSSTVACGGCHALPPAPSTGHPAVAAALTGCALCHPETMNPDGSLDLAGGTHLDGRVQVTHHGDYSSPTVHGPKALDFLGGLSGSLDCRGCHGQDLGGGYGPSCTACHAAAGWTGWQTNCSFCHGTRNASTQAGYDVATRPTWAAPPDAVSQRLGGAAAPARTGAHQAHLAGATAAGLSFAAPFTCQTCHPVATGLDHVRGAAARAVVTLSGAGQAHLAPSLGSYDPAGGSCATYCHGASPSPAWSATGLTCGACHDLPPATSTGHPDAASDLTTCVLCHAATMKADGTLDLAGGKHLDGTVEASGHPDLSAPSLHGPQFLAFLRGAPGALRCTACHGQDYAGGFGPSCTACHTAAGWTGWQSNCSFCHGTKSAATQAGYAVADHPTWAAPPDALAQRLDPAHAPVPARTGAHQAHLSGLGSDGLYNGAPPACPTCHAVPVDLTHAGGPGRAPVTLHGSGSLPASLGTYDPVTSTCASNYCHDPAGTGQTSPAWSGGALGCTTCHGYPPSSGQHDFHMSDPSVQDNLGRPIVCGDCHAITATTDSPAFVIPGTPNHVNGLVDVSFAEGGQWFPGPRQCAASCHNGFTTNW